MVKKKKKIVKKKKDNRKQFEVWANKKMKEIQEVLLLQNFNLNPIEYRNVGGGVVGMSMNHYPYKEITISYADQAYEWWKEGKKKDALAVLVHELFHPITDPLYCKGTNRYSTQDELNDVREELTDHLSNIIINLGVLKP